LVARNAGVAELADALDSKSKNHRFDPLNRRETPLTIFIGKLWVCWSIGLISERRLYDV